ncbi:hypothetical protein EYF80_059301 [Liparis tanakae]|uniref:Uncharacterized protein n=1 Tax=Liparis tanakae TaxID=230148 RepID=A0A4Z2ENN4_9TELE|nr:hypothetical protein EYF80_059301 [Liparis tanakae]
MGADRRGRREACRRLCDADPPRPKKQTVSSFRRQRSRGQQLHRELVSFPDALRRAESSGVKG